MPRSRRFVVMGLTIPVGFSLGWCSASPSPRRQPQQRRPPLHRSRLPSRQTNPRRATPSSRATNTRTSCLSFRPTSTIRAKPSGRSRRGSTKPLRPTVGTPRTTNSRQTSRRSLTEVGDSAEWARIGTPTDTQFTAIQTECGALLAKGLVHSEPMAEPPTGQTGPGAAPSSVSQGGGLGDGLFLAKPSDRFWRTTSEAVHP